MKNSTHRSASATGAGAIFGATGGVMEAALRTAVETLTDTKLDDQTMEFHDVRGTEGIKEASYQVGDLNVKVAVASGLANAKKLLERHQRGQKRSITLWKLWLVPADV